MLLSFKDYSLLEGKNRDKKAFVIFIRHNKKDNCLEIYIDDRGKEPYHLPGGRLDPNEDFLDGLVREIKEETKYDINKKDLYPIQTDDREHYYYATLTEDIKLNSKSDLQNGKWVPVQKLPMDNYYTPLVYKAIYLKYNKLDNHNESVNEGKEYKEIVDQILKKPNGNKEGALIVFEGIDGAGKSTQIEMLKKWLTDQGYNVKFTAWGSHEIFKKSLKKVKKKQLLNNISYFLVHAADLVLRYTHDILPALKLNKLVVCDRYVYTSYVRDSLRGVNEETIKSVFKDLKEPDIIFYCKVPIDVAFGRLLNAKGLSYYGSGMDLNYNLSIEENCIKYQHEMQKKYDEILKNKMNVKVLDMNRAPDQIFNEVISTLSDKFSIGKYSQSKLKVA